MRSYIGRQVWVALTLCMLAFAGAGNADVLSNNEVDFTGAISSLVVNGEGVGTLFIRLEDFDLRVIVNSNTEITSSKGDAMGMDDLKAGDRIAIKGKYSASGVLAAEIRLQDSAGTDFHVRGTITKVATSTDSTLLTLLGIQVVVNADTKISDGSAALGISSLKTGVQVQIEGAVTADGWIAKSISVQSSEKKSEQVRFEGTVKTLSSSSMDVAVDSLPGNVTGVALDSKTRIVGDLAVGAHVYVIGTLNSDLTVTARQVRVVLAFEVKPDEKKLKVGESATFIVKLHETAANDVPVSLKIADVTIASLSAATVTIPKGGITTQFTVKGGPQIGSTEITAEALGQKVTVTIKVGAVSEDENENNAGTAVAVFAPEKIKLGFNETRDVLLLIKPPQHAAVTVDLKVTNGIVKIAGTSGLSNGVAAFKVSIQSGNTAGSDSVVATLPKELGGGKAELFVEVSANKGDTSNKKGAQIDFGYRQVKLAAGESLEVTLVSSQSFDKDVTIAVAVAKGADSVEVPSTVTLLAGTKSVKFTIKAKSDGEAKVVAALPADKGGDTAVLMVHVGK